MYLNIPYFEYAGSVKQFDDINKSKKRFLWLTINPYISGTHFWDSPRSAENGHKCVSEIFRFIINYGNASRNYHNGGNGALPHFVEQLTHFLIDRNSPFFHIDVEHWCIYFFLEPSFSCILEEAPGDLLNPIRFCTFWTLISKNILRFFKSFSLLLQVTSLERERKALLVI